jgi:hypothetical protein
VSRVDTRVSRVDTHLSKVLDGVDVVVRRRADERHAGLAGAQRRDVRAHLGTTRVCSGGLSRETERNVSDTNQFHFTPFEFAILNLFEPSAL